MPKFWLFFKFPFLKHHHGLIFFCAFLIQNFGSLCTYNLFTFYLLFFSGNPQNHYMVPNSPSGRPFHHHHNNHYNHSHNHHNHYNMSKTTPLMMTTSVTERSWSTPATSTTTTVNSNNNRSSRGIVHMSR